MALSGHFLCSQSVDSNLQKAIETFCTVNHFDMSREAAMEKSD